MTSSWIYPTGQEEISDEVSYDGLLSYGCTMARAGWQKRLLEVIQETPGLTMKALSKKAGLNDGYISEMLKKDVKPTIEVFLAIAEAAEIVRKKFIDPS